MPRVATRLNLNTSPFQALRNALNPATFAQPSFNLGAPQVAPLLPVIPPVNIPPMAAPRPAPGPGPSPYVPPFNNPLDMLQPGPSTMPVPQPALNRCCPCKQPERKKREPRTKCRQGTYTQTSKGIIYTPRRQVPCR